jgi:hypothetical protein
MEKTCTKEFKVGAPDARQRNACSKPSLIVYKIVLIAPVCTVLAFTDDRRIE